MMYAKLTFLLFLFEIALSAPVEVTSATGVVEVPLNKALTYKSHQGLNRRSDTPESSIYYAEYEYDLFAQIGSQTQTLTLDTGSSDTWTHNIANVFLVGYTPGYDSTYKWLNDDFHTSYGNGSYQVTGSWVQDTLTLGNASVPDYPFGLLNTTLLPGQSGEGLFGIGPKISETSPHPYPTYLERLKESGEIQSNSFSLFNNLDSSSATLLFGGIDTAKFNGTLYTLGFDTAQWYDKYHYHVDFNFESVTYDGLLDTGTPTILLPYDIADSLAAKYGAIWHPSWGVYVVPEKPQEVLPGLEIEIGGITISIPFSDLFITYSDGTLVFAVSRSIKVGDSYFNVLGDPILKQLYLFFDLDKSEIAFAPIVLTNESNLVPVGDSIPYSTPAPNPHHS